QVAADKGHKVLLVDVNQQLAEKGKNKITASLDKLVQKGKLALEARDALLSRITPAGEYGALSSCDFVVEAATENQELNRKLFANIDRALGERAILASNTSSISITLLAAETSRPEQVIGMHFMNPVPVMKLVELIRGLQTSDATYQATVALA